MLALLESLFDNIDLDKLLEHAVQGLHDVHSIKVLSLIIISRAAEIAPNETQKYLDSVADVLPKMLNFKTDDLTIKQELEKNAEIKRSALRALVTLSTLCDEQTCPKFTKLVEDIVSGPLAEDFEAAKRDKEMPILSGHSNSGTGDQGKHYGKHVYPMDLS